MSWEILRVVGVGTGSLASSSRVPEEPLSDRPTTVPEPLPPDRVRALLAGLPGWTDAGRGCIEKTYRFPDFRAAAEFVCRVADAADAADHPPECDVAWGRVTVRLRTHEAGGVTERDFALARALEDGTR